MVIKKRVGVKLKNNGLSDFRRWLQTAEEVGSSWEQDPATLGDLTLWGGGGGSDAVVSL